MAGDFQRASSSTSTGAAGTRGRSVLMSNRTERDDPETAIGKTRKLMPATWNSRFDWDDEGWREQAACRRTDPDLFFPAGQTGIALDQIEAAKAVCRSCPVQRACLRFALETNQEAGIWGGLDEDERRKVRSARSAARRRALSASIG